MLACPPSTVVAIYVQCQSAYRTPWQGRLAVIQCPLSCLISPLPLLLAPCRPQSRPLRPRPPRLRPHPPAVSDSPYHHVHACISLAAAAPCKAGSCMCISACSHGVAHCKAVQRHVYGTHATENALTNWICYSCPTLCVTDGVYRYVLLPHAGCPPFGGFELRVYGNPEVYSTIGLVELLYNCYITQADTCVSFCWGSRDQYARVNTYDDNAYCPYPNACYYIRGACAMRNE